MYSYILIIYLDRIYEYNFRACNRMHSIIYERGLPGLKNKEFIHCTEQHGFELFVKTMSRESFCEISSRLRFYV